MTSPPPYIPAKGTAVLAPSVRIFISATIVVIGTATAAMFLKNPAEPQAASAEIQSGKTGQTAVVEEPVKSLPAVPAVTLAALPQMDTGAGKIGQVYPPPALPELPVAIPVTENKIKTTSKKTAEWKGFSDINTEFKTIHSVPKPPSAAEHKPSKSFEKRMAALSSNELNDAMLTMFQFADNLQPTVKKENSQPNNPFQDTESGSGLNPLLQSDPQPDEKDNGSLHPLAQKETLFELKPLRQVNTL